MRHNHNSNKGFLSIKTIFIIISLLSIIILGKKVIPLYYSYYELLGQMQAQVNKSDQFSEKHMREYIYSIVEKQQIPLAGPEDIEINFHGNNVSISCAYEETIEIEVFGKNYTLFILHFNPEVEK